MARRIQALTKDTMSLPNLSIASGESIGCFNPAETEDFEKRSRAISKWIENELGKQIKNQCDNWIKFLELKRRKGRRPNDPPRWVWVWKDPQSDQENDFAEYFLKKSDWTREELWLRNKMQGTDFPRFWAPKANRTGNYEIRCWVRWERCRNEEYRYQVS